MSTESELKEAAHATNRRWWKQDLVNEGVPTAFESIFIEEMQPLVVSRDMEIESLRDTNRRLNRRYQAAVKRKGLEKRDAEIARLWKAIQAGTPWAERAAELAETEGSYADYAAWEQWMGDQCDQPCYHTPSEQDNCICGACQMAEWWENGCDSLTRPTFYTLMCGLAERGAEGVARMTEQLATAQKEIEMLKGYKQSYLLALGDLMEPVEPKP